ncbi:hypothetical protein MG293_014127 [Ovis ammon polii]|uniref:VWFA domain-containing protein n=1 Tax=Ovis ammon polii TaxID=230172 RepID=A0AAD4U182_OVIAM|nr:hypothetical protein MG293_014127 [Ovis ammon polii]
MRPGRTGGTPLQLMLMVSQGILNCCVAYNVGLPKAKIFSGPSSEQFGYAVQQFINPKGNWLLVGSPWSGFPKNRMGDVYKCPVDLSTTTCEKLNLQITWGPTVSKFPTQFDDLIKPVVPCGHSSAEVSITQPGFALMSVPIFSCGPALRLQFRMGLIQYANNPRVVFNLNTFKSKNEMIKATSQTYQYGGDLTNTFKAIQYARDTAYSMAAGGRPGATKVMVVVTDGESHDGSKLKAVIDQCNKDNILRFGIAVLGYLNRNALDTKNLIKEIKAIASIPTERHFFNVSDEADLLEKAGTIGEQIFSIEGYSVASISTGNSVHFVAGAPRANYTGQIVLYSVNENGNVTVLQSHRGDQIGSYFGSVLCAVDVNKDTITDVLLVGAPMYMNDLKKEEGRVYLFTITKGILNWHQFLEGPKGLENARFGSAIAALSDINMDGFNDVIVGSPLENQNSGAVYIYNGHEGMIRLRYSQKILGSDRAFSSHLQYFGRSLDGYGDLNGDSITDVSVGAFGQVVQLWSQSIADVSVDASFTPKKITLLNKNAEIKLKLCFSAKFRPTNQNNQVAIVYNITIDEDQFSSRVTSRGLFKENNERCLQKTMIVSQAQRCSEYIIHIQEYISLTLIYVVTCCYEPSDTISPLNLCVNISLENPGTNPALEAYSETVKVFSIPFHKDCGDDGVCISDLVLNVQQLPATQQQPFIVSNQNKRLTFSVKLENKKESAYNTEIVVDFSENLFFASWSMPVDGTEVTCQIASSQKSVTCNVGYPALKSKQQVTFTINFDFNLQNLQNQASISFRALSESQEENMADNSVNLKLSLLYDAEIHITRSTNINFYEVSLDGNVSSVVHSFEDIGPKFIFSIKVTTGSVPVSMASVIIHIPQHTTGRNPLMYLTGVHTDQAGDISCKAEINPLKIGQTSSSISFKSENFWHIKELSTFQTVQLTAAAEINTYNPQIYVIEENTVTLGFFKRKYEKMAKNPDETDETTELNS